MSLNHEEKEELVRLMRKAEFPLPRDVFNAWCENFTVPCIEVVFLRDGVNGRELFLTYRDDGYFKGWHIPGAVIQAGENVEEVLRRIARDELQGVEFTPRFFSWFECLKVTGVGESARGHVITLIFSAEAPDTLRESELAKFFPLSKTPGDLITEHVPIIEELRKA